MGECLILKVGAGTDTSNATAKSEHILSGYTAYVNDMLITGTMVNHGSISNELSAGDIVELKEGYYELSTLTIKTLASQTKATAISSDILASKTAWVNGSLLTGNMVNRGAVAYSLPINGAYTIPSGFHNGAGKVTQSIATQGGWTITPSTGNILACDTGRYTTGAIWVAGDGNLVSGNIRKGVSIFGVGGTALTYVPDKRLIIFKKSFDPNKTNLLSRGGVSKLGGYNVYIDEYDNICADASQRNAYAKGRTSGTFPTAGYKTISFMADANIKYGQWSRVGISVDGNNFIAAVSVVSTSFETYTIDLSNYQYGNVYVLFEITFSHTVYGNPGLAIKQIYLDI